MDGIIFIGNPPMYPSGYGKQLALIQKHLAGKYFMAHICDFGYDGPAFEYNGVTVYGVAEHPGVLTTKHIDKCISNFLGAHPIDKWIIIGLGNLYNRGILENYPSLLLSVVETSELSSNELHSISTSIPVAISSFGQEVINAHGFECNFLVPHAVDTSLLPSKSSRALRSTKDWPFASTKGFVVGFFGDFSVRKSPELLLEVWPAFSEGKNDAHLWIHHSNHKDMDYMTLQAIRAHPRIHVSTTDEGWNDSQMLEKLKSLDCLFHPSNREGFGVFQAEAQCVGTPVVSYHAGPATEINVNPQLVSPNKNADELVHRLDFIYGQWKSQNFSLNVQTSKLAIEKFNPQNSFAQLPKAIDFAFREFYPEPKHSTPRKMKHVCIVSTWGIDCGIATYTSMLAHELSKNCKVTILAEGRIDPSSISEPSPNITVIHCWDRHFPSGGSIKGVLDALNPDIIHIQHETSLFKVQHDLLSEIYSTDAKIVTTFHTPDFAKNEIVDFAMQSDLTIMHNRPLAEKMNGSLPNAVQYIPHGVKQATQTGTREECGGPKAIPVFFNYGFCSPSKGVLELIRAAKMLKEETLVDSNGDPLTTTHFEVVIYAGKSNKEYYERCVSEAEGVSGISISDEVLPEVGIDFWATQADFAVFPYTSANHPFQINSTSGALMRILDSRIPIIATDEGRLRDITGGIHGWKCSMGSVEALAQCLRSAVNQFNFNKKAYHAMCESVGELADSYSWANAAKAHIDSYKQIANLHHYRTKTPVFKPRGRTEELPLFTDASWGEEE